MINELKILLSIPAYNEESVIGSVIDGIPKTIRIGDRPPVELDLLVVNDGSDDGTASSVRQSRRKSILVNHVINMGAGGATLTALEYAKTKNYDFMATMDADGQHDINDVIKALNKCVAGNYDLIVGNRLGSSRPKSMSSTKYIGNVGISLLTKLILGSSVNDSQSGLRVYSRKSINQLRFNSLGYIFCSEMLMRAKGIKLKVGEVKIKAIYTDYSKAKGQSSWNGIEFIRKMVILRLMEIF